MSDLQAAFDNAVAESKTLANRPDNQTLLKIYSLFKQATEGFGRKQARRAAAKEDRTQLSVMYLRQISIEIGQQGVDVFFFRQVGPGGVGVEVAIRALLHAPGNVHIECKGRQRKAAAGRGGHARPSRCFSKAIARARWLIWFFSAAGSSALEQSRSGTQNSGS